MKELQTEGFLLRAFKEFAIALGYSTDVKKEVMKIVRLLIWIAAFFVAWTGIDYINSTFISKEGFVFAPVSNLIIPVACWVIVWFLLEKKKSNKG